MNKQSFLDLLTRYQAGKCTESEKYWIDQWYGLLGTKNVNNLSPAELDDMKDNIWLKLQNQIPARKSRTLKLGWFKTAIAAAVTIAFIIAGVYAFSNHAERAFLQQNNQLDLISKTNTTGGDIKVSLNDESIIILKPGANIIFPKIFAANNRKVYLKGNAFFSITKNQAKPFYVYNNKLVIRVVGTSFYVNESVDQKASEVAVRTGKVQVNENTDNALISLPGTETAKPVFLTPNQKGSFAAHKIRATLVDKPLPLAVAYHEQSKVSYNFKEESLKKIFLTLSEAYGIEIKSENEKILGYTFTGDLTGRDLYDQLSLICGSISARYVISGTSILISTKTNQ